MGKHQDNFLELIKVGKRDLFASRFYQLFKSALMLLVLLFFLTWLEGKHILPTLVFQSIGTSIIVLALTVVWDRMKSSRRYRNLCMALATELFFIYIDALLCSEGLSSEKLMLKLDIWKEIKLTLAEYMPTFWYQKLFALYKNLEEINNKEPLKNIEKIRSIRISIEQCYPMIASTAKGATLPTLEFAIEYIAQNTDKPNNRKQEK